ncbi:PLP-dependent aminotransferase family protein [Fulvimonas yonginensis]|uniref:PLP-dependent aminotransferase family protein n=1 Tax=Fulvimonas yonginensis TaxID=1495200 RepID=A0ABU8JB33_9GAMM
MRRWELTLSLDPALPQPLFLQLAQAVTDAIRQGRLKPGEALPGTRELAGMLGVNRNTVVAGYAELAAEGLVQTRIGGGTFVAAQVPAPRPQALAGDPAPTFELAPPLPLPPPFPSAPPGALPICNAMPDVRLFPAQALARAFRRALGQRQRVALGMPDACGHPRLRTELAAMLAHTRSLPVTSANLMVTRSIEQAIDLVARTLLQPGDVVVVEALGYPPAWRVLELAGARLLALPLDERGLDVGALETLLPQQRIRAVFLTPHHQFPTTVVMPPARRARLGQLAVKHGFAIVEDDYDHEFHYAGKPVLPIAAGPHRANVVYVGSLSNLLAPGIGTGFVTAPPSVFPRLASLRAASDARGDAAVECAIAELFEDGELLRHVRRMRRTYATRRDALAEALHVHLGGALRFRLPDGGMGLWAKVDPAIDLNAWCAAGGREGVQFFDATRYDFHRRPQPCLRLGFSYLDERELDEAVRRMARALASLHPVPPPRQRGAGPARDAIAAS